eukprot:TRINITY_DN56119_c0_g1_i1.p1 TRINITY_DN56119_c0_g1~~TRINITY_DN56119_c0_g1_i1.p1  ORF type:complete len:288 (-),score=9.92 TRINITY_DN56119_c0_g1_i1:143-1006(-)
MAAPVSRLMHDRSATSYRMRVGINIAKLMIMAHYIEMLLDMLFGFDDWREELSARTRYGVYLLWLEIGLLSFGTLLFMCAPPRYLFCSWVALLVAQFLTSVFVEASSYDVFDSVSALGGVLVTAVLLSDRAVEQSNSSSELRGNSACRRFGTFVLRCMVASHFIYELQDKLFHFRYWKDVIWNEAGLGVWSLWLVIMLLGIGTPPLLFASSRYLIVSFYCLAVFQIPTSLLFEASMYESMDSTSALGAVLALALLLDDRAHPPLWCCTRTARPRNSPSPCVLLPDRC